MSRSAPKTPAWWFGDAPVPWWARLLAPLYGAAVALRRRLYRRRLLRTRRVAAPVLVIGNLAAGGAGKTPLALAVVQRLVEAGWRPGGRSKRGGIGAAGSAQRDRRSGFGAAGSARRGAWRRPRSQATAVAAVFFSVFGARPAPDLRQQL